MKTLLAGVLLFSLVHLLPAGAPPLKRSLAEAMGDNAYKGIFGLLIIGAIVMMVAGWKATSEDELYAAPEWGGVIAFVLTLGTSIMFFAPYMANNIRRFIRHPQLTGILLFGLGHLAAVGNVRSVVLFGGLGLWAVLEMLLINRRDAAWVRPEPVPRKADLKLLVAGAGFFLIFLFTHEALFGVSPLPD